MVRASQMNTFFNPSVVVIGGGNSLIINNIYFFVHGVFRRCHAYFYALKVVKEITLSGFIPANLSFAN